MFYVEVALGGLAIVIALSILLLNLIKRFNYNLNRCFALIALVFAAEFALILSHLLNIDFISLDLKGRIFAGLLLYLLQLFFHLIYIYPDKKVMPVLWFFLATGTPGLLLAITTAATDFIIQRIVVKEYVWFVPGKFFIVYIIFLAFYSLLIVINILQKFRMSETRALSRDLVNFISGIFGSSIILILLTLFMPILFQYNDLIYIGIFLTSILMLFIINYGVIDFSALNFKKYYFKIVSWSVICVIIYIPVFLILEYSNDVVPNDQTSIAGISIVIFFFLFVSLNFLKSRSDMLFQIEYNNLMTSILNFFTFIGQISISEDLSVFWESFYKNTIDGICEKYGIVNATLFIYNKKEKVFSSIYHYGEKLKHDKIDENNPLIKSMQIYPKVIEESMLYSNLIFTQYMKDTTSFFDNNNIKIALPFVDHEKEVFAFLLLGDSIVYDADMITSLPRKKIYSMTFLSVLESYRTQFQYQLLNGLILEDVKATQMLNHDSMVVGSIKKRIIPEVISQVKGIKISSFNINNSSHGGDYFDSIKINDDTLCLFLSDSSYSGVESAILSLELFSVLHTQSKKNNSPEMVLNTMNWIVSTSEFSTKYIPAFCLFYSSGKINFSSAAYNPLIIFNPEKNEFTDFESKGIPIGLEKDYQYEIESSGLNPGSIGIISSNGLAASIDKSGMNFSIDRIKNIVNLNKDKSPSIIVRKIYEDYEVFSRDTKQNNDVSVIIFKV